MSSIPAAIVCTVCGSNAPASLFDPSNPLGSEMRRKCAEAALVDALASLDSADTAVAIFDATNSTKSRRAWLRDAVAAHGDAAAAAAAAAATATVGAATAAAKVAAPSRVKLVFLESVCDNDATVWNNVKEAKLHSPDYEVSTLLLALRLLKVLVAMAVAAPLVRGCAAPVLWWQQCCRVQLHSCIVVDKMCCMLMHE
jgi:6-phosphofructo-2-kinase